MSRLQVEPSGTGGWCSHRWDFSSNHRPGDQNASLETWLTIHSVFPDGVGPYQLREREDTRMAPVGRTSCSEAAYRWQRTARASGTVNSSTAGQRGPGDGAGFRRRRTGFRAARPSTCRRDQSWRRSVTSTASTKSPPPCAADQRQRSSRFLALTRRLCQARRQDGLPAIWNDRPRR